MLGRGSKSMIFKNTIFNIEIWDRCYLNEEEQRGRKKVRKDISGIKL